MADVSRLSVSISFVSATAHCVLFVTEILNVLCGP
jgi:hypothetical protein